MVFKQAAMIFKNDVIKSNSQGRDYLPKTNQQEGNPESCIFAPAVL